MNSLNRAARAGRPSATGSNEALFGWLLGAGSALAVRTASRRILEDEDREVPNLSPASAPGR